MDLDSQSSAKDFRLNLRPEKHHHQLHEMEIDTLRSSKRSGSPRTLTRGPDGDEECQHREECDISGLKSDGKRQMRLDISSGTLATKKPFFNPMSRQDQRRQAMAEVAKDTLLILPGLLATRPDVTDDGFLCQRQTIDSKFCPTLSAVKIRVVNCDTIDAALDLQTQRSMTHKGRPVAILNMANAQVAGGGWQHGALAQEEALCYRTSLSRTLKRKHYPIPDDAVIYSPTVMVIRESIQNGNDRLDYRDPRKLEVLSVISCAAVCQPSLKKDASGSDTYKNKGDKQLMLEKMRMVLRTAIRNRHRQVVLGALGCGAFGNPNHEVAAMWGDILQEQEFQGGWWEDIVFAVLSAGRDGNHKVFSQELHDLLLE